MRLFYILLSIFVFLSFNLSSQEYADVWLQAWVKNEGTSNTLAGRNLSVTVADFVYDAVHQLNDDGQHDLVLSKTTLKGTVQWLDTFNLSATTANMLLGDITVDGNGDIIITGAVYNGTNNYDVITVKYTGAGVLSWHQLYNGSASSYDGGLRVITDSSNNIYITGGATSTSNAMDLLILAYNSAGTLSWSEIYDGHGNFDAGSHLSINGSLTVVGVSQTTDPTLWRIASRKYQLSNGTLIAGAESSDVALTEVRDVVMDSNDDIYVTGWKFTLGQGKDAVIVKWSDGAGSVDWEVVYNGTASGDDFMNSIAVASNGDVVVGGYTTTGNGDQDGLLLKYSTTGQLLWEQSCSGASGGDDEITDVLLDETAGEVYLAGQVREYADADYLFERRMLSDGTLQHQEIFAGWVGGDDKAEVLLKDADNGVILSGKTAAGGGSEKPTTVRYQKETYFLPPNTEEPHASLPYIHNNEQLTQTNGKVADKVRYYVQGSPAKYLRRKKMHLVLSSIDTVPSTPDTLCRVDIDFSGDKGQRIYAMDKRASYHNYYLGHINEGRTKVALTDEILHRDAWLGIDILHGSNNAGVTYDFIVQPGVDPSLIEMTFSGHTSLTINGAGELEIGTDLSTITWPAPGISNYDAQGVEYPVFSTVAYSVVGTDKVRIIGMGTNATRYQVVSVRNTPSVSSGGGGANLEWCSFLGGNLQDFVNDIGTRSTPNGDDLFATGYTSSINFPFLNGFQIESGGDEGETDAFLTRFDNDINLVWSTYLGGNNNEEAFTVLVEDETITIGGTAPTRGTAANSTEFPLMDNEVSYYDDQNKCSGDNTNCADGFIACFLFDGTAEHITFLGDDGASNDAVQDVIQYVNDGYLVVGRGADGTRAIESGSYIDSDGRSFINKFSADFADLTWGTRFPASQINEVEVDQNNNIFIAGVSQRFDETPIEAEDDSAYLGPVPTSDEAAAFITKFSPTPHIITWSTYFGGNTSFEQLYDLKLTPNGEPVIVGWTRSDDFPVTDNVSSPFTTSFTESDNGFYSQFSNVGALLFSGLLGSQINDLDIEGNGEISLVATSNVGAPPLPVTGPAGTLQVTTPSAGYFLVMNENRNPT
ncbi:MAG: hypothetical protein AAFO02_17700, partial [Bacteroidota bacterium]